MKATISASLLFFLVACRQTDSGGAAEAAAPAEPRYLALGDSFTIGTGASVERAFPARLVERWRVGGCAVALKNVAVNGYTTDDLIGEELPVVASFRPTFVTIAIGANDIVRGRSIDTYRANVKRILDATRASGARVVVLPQPDWSRSPTAAAFGTPDSLAKSIHTFNVALAEEAAAHGARYVNLERLMIEQADKKLIAADGLHPSADAYDAWAGELARAVDPPCAR